MHPDPTVASTTMVTSSIPRRLLRSLGAVVLLGGTAACGATGGPSVLADAPAYVAPGQDAPNTCPLDLTRWGMIRGAQPTRTGDSYRQANNGTTSPSFYLPQQRNVRAGQEWQFAFDTTVEAPTGAARVRIEVDWYSATGGDAGHIGHDDGPWVDVPLNSTDPTTISHTFTVPENAERANVLTDLSVDNPDNTWTGRNCDYRRVEGQSPTTTTTNTSSSEPATPTTTEAPPTATTTRPTPTSAVATCRLWCAAQTG